MGLELKQKKVIDLSLPRQTCKVCMRTPITQMCRYQCKESRITKNQENMTPTKETNKAPRTDANKMEIYELSDK